MSTLKTKQILCSVCIANYNGEEYLGNCIDSILEQDVDFLVEIIVHDDASTDNSVKYIRENFPEAILIESKENVGFCISNNRMVAKAKGEYILVLNNDAVLLHDALRVLHEESKKVKKPAILGLRQFCAQTGELIDFGIVLDPFMNSIPNKDFNRTEVAMVIGACMWLPKQLWDQIGGFPDWFHTMHEDMYLCSMGRLLGYPVRMAEQSGYKHWVGKSLGGGKVTQNRLSTTFKRRASSERNRIYVMVLCCPNPMFAIIFPLHIVLLFLEGAVLSLVKRDKKILNEIYVEAFRSFWHKRQKLFSLRHQIQKKVIVTSRDFFSAFSPVPYKLKMLVKYGFPDLA